METKEYLLNELCVPAEYVKGLNLSDFPRIIKGTPAWAIYYKILKWIDEKREKPIENRDAFDRLSAYCHIVAANDFDKNVFADEEMRGWFSWGFCFDWANIFINAAEHYSQEGNDILCDGEKAIRFYEKALQLDPDMTYALVGIGNVYYCGIGGVAPDYQKALEYYQQSENDWALGNYYSEGIAVTPDYPLAINYFTKDLKGCEEWAPPEIVSLIHESLSKCYEAIGDAKKAAEHRAFILKENK